MKTRIRIIVIIAFSRFSVNISRRSVSRIRMYSIVIEESLAFHFNSNHRRTTLLEQSNETSAKDIHETNKKRSQPSGAAFPHFPHSFVVVFVFMLLAAFPGVLYRTENTRTPDRKASSLSVSKSTKVVLKLSSAYYVYENMRTKGRKRNVAKCKWMLVERMFKDSTLASGLSYDEKGKKLRRPRRRRQKLLRVMLVCERVDSGMRRMLFFNVEVVWVWRLRHERWMKITGTENFTHWKVCFHSFIPTLNNVLSCQEWQWDELMFSCFCPVPLKIINVAKLIRLFM